MPGAIAVRMLREPFRIHGTALDPNLLLMLKLVVIGLVLKGYHNSFPDAFAPFFQVLDYLPNPAFRRGLKLVFLISAGFLLFNRAVRFNAMVIGVVFLAGPLASKVYYRNAIAFVAVLFLLTALQERGKPPRLLWWQLGVMYVGAGINKLFEADWRTGGYFDYFLTKIFDSGVYAALAPHFPGKSLALMLCWWIIVAELMAGVLFFSRRAHAQAVWFAASVHIGAAFLVIGDYGIYLSAVLASYLCVVQWPSTLVRRFGLPVFAVAVDGLEYRGFAAVWRWVVYSPTTYFCGVVFMTIPYEPWRVFAVRTFGAVGSVVLPIALVWWIFSKFGAAKQRGLLSDGRKIRGDATGGAHVDMVNRVLIVSTLTPFTRNLVWAAGHAGLLCDVVTDTAHASWSKMANVERIVRVPPDRVAECDPALLPEVFATFPKAYAAVLTPGDTRASRLVYRSQSELPPRITPFPQCSAEWFERLYDKGSFSALLDELGLPQPKTHVIRSTHELDGLPLDYPVIAKPAASEGSFGFAPLGTRDALNGELKRLGVGEGATVLVQSYIPGEDIDMSLLADRGRIVAWTIQQRISEERMRFVEHEGVYDACSRLIAATKYHGVMHFDLRIDSRDKSLVFIEANPRFWGSMCYSTWADVNFLQLGIELAAGTCRREPVRAKLGEYPYLGVTRRALPQVLLGGLPAPKQLTTLQQHYWKFYHRWGNGGLHAWFGQYVLRGKA